MPRSRSEDTRKRQKQLGSEGYTCFWCWCPVTSVADIPRHKRIRIRNRKIIWRGDGKIKEGALATLDHLRPIGNSKTVISCAVCNEIRGRFMDETLWIGRHGGVREGRKLYIMNSWTRRIRESRSWRNRLVEKEAQQSGSVGLRGPYCESETHGKSAVC